MSSDASWIGSMPEVYHRCLGPALFAPYASHVSGLVTAHSPEHVLELAAGTGIATAELVRALPDAGITATDLNPAMVSWAAGQVTGPTWLAADAQSLEFPDRTFDVVVCQFGVMFFPDKAKAFAEAARVLRPGGAMVFTVWDSVETSDFPAALVDGLATIVPEGPPDFVVRIPHGYHEPSLIERDLAAGGLVLEGIHRLVLRGRAPSAAVIAEGFCLGTPLRFELQRRGDLEQLMAVLAAEMTTRLGPGPIEGDLAAFVVVARRPG